MDGVVGVVLRSCAGYFLFHVTHTGAMTAYWGLPERS